MSTTPSTDETLCVTETNSAGDESQGTIWGVDYTLFWLALSGVFVSGLLFAALFQAGWTLGGSLLTASVPAGVILSWVIFKQTHPPGYDTDLLDLWLRGPGFGPKIIDPNLP